MEISTLHTPHLGSPKGGQKNRENIFGRKPPAIVSRNKAALFKSK